MFRSSSKGDKQDTGENVLDLFCGRRSTLIAAEPGSRKAFSMKTTAQRVGATGVRLNRWWSTISTPRSRQTPKPSSPRGLSGFRLS